MNMAFLIKLVCNDESENLRAAFNTWESILFMKLRFMNYHFTLLITIDVTDY